MTRSFLLRLCLALVLAGAAATLLGLYLRAPETEQDDSRSYPQSPTPGVPWFVDVTRSAGIDFSHFDSASDVEYIPETLGSGVAWIDYDGDGWPDLFVVQDGPLRPETRAPPSPSCKL